MTKAELAHMVRDSMLEGWIFERIDTPPFKRIAIEAPNGYSTVVDSMSRNPANILYMLADSILTQQENATNATIE